MHEYKLTAEQVAEHTPAMKKAMWDHLVGRRAKSGFANMAEYNAWLTQRRST